MIINFIRGFCMALADSVPGVSGGTIALLLGFYDKFINSLNAFIKGTKEEKIQAVKFLVKIGVGWIVGFCLAILFITSMFDSHIYEISSLFIGFILFALPVMIIEEKDCLKGRYVNSIYVLIGAVLVCGITYFSAHTLEGKGVNLALGKCSNITLLLVMLSGMLAIAAMLLPGISGSTIIMIFGLYVPITTAIKEVLHFQLQYVPALAIFGFGIILGAGMVVQLIQIALKRYRSQTMYCVLGMMLGSIYSITQGPTTLDVPRAPLSWDTFSILFFVIGGIIILGMQKMKSMLDKE